MKHNTGKPHRKRRFHFCEVNFLPEETSNSAQHLHKHINHALFIAKTPFSLFLLLSSSITMVQMFYYDCRGKNCHKVLRHEGFPTKILLFPYEGGQRRQPPAT